jgi:hypothetical protein
MDEEEKSQRIQQEVSKVAYELGWRVATRLFEGESKAVIDVLMTRRQRNINLCREKWGEETARAYNRAFVTGLYGYANEHATEHGMEKEDAEEIISRWSTEFTSRKPEGT